MKSQLTYISISYLIFLLLSGNVRTEAENIYDTDLSVKHLDIFIKTDFQSNTVDAVVKATIENLSNNNVDNAEFLVCPGENDPDFGAEIKHIYLLDKNEKNNLSFAMQTTEDIYNKGNEWEIYVVSLDRPVKPREKLVLEFEYKMKGKTDHSSTPIFQSKEGLKELYLRGNDWKWCPTLYVKREKRVFPNIYKPSWTMRMEYPSEYLAVANGELVNRDIKGEVIKDKWKSAIDETPHAYISQYKVLKHEREGAMLEVYAHDEELLKKAAVNIDNFDRIFNLYVELYGDPGATIYRIVGSPTQGSGGMSMAMGQVIGPKIIENTSIVAHEMSHTWWGDLVTSYGEGSKFLREALAVFSEMYATGCINKEINFDDLIRERKRGCFCYYIAASKTSMQCPLIQQPGYDSNRTMKANYERGPLVLNHLRFILGDEVFFKCLKTFVENYKGKTVNIHDFIDTFNIVSGKDMTNDLKNLLWNPGYPSYRLIEFESNKEDSGYRTIVRIRNDGDYGLDCPLALEMKKGEERKVFRVEGRSGKKFEYKTDKEVIDITIDPDLTAFHYHPQQKVNLWLHYEPSGRSNWECYGKSYMYYLMGKYDKAIDTITEYFSNDMEKRKFKNIEELAVSNRNVPYLFMRGIYYLEYGDKDNAEKDIKTAFHHMLDVSLRFQDKTDWLTSSYRNAGIINKVSQEQYLSLLSLIAGREFSFDPGMDDEAKLQKIEEWKQWWEKEGRHKKLDLTPLKKRFEAHRKAVQ